MNPNKIYLLGDSRQDEGVAAEAITPGQLVAMDANGEYVKHASAGSFAETVFAQEDALQGKTIDDAYADGDRVFLLMAQPGDVVYAWLAAGENVTPADFLSSNGDGTLQKATITDVRLAKPLESLDLSESGSVATRLRVRVI